jgi:CRP/FNR family transcriptional regulator, anaerobic regulatory protein
MHLKNLENIEQCMALFPALLELDIEHQKFFKDVVKFKQLSKGETAYQPGWDCSNFLMCLSGQTRVYRSSESGREILLYKVSSGQTCVLTTSCLMGGSTFPAESIAEQDTLLAAIPENKFNELMDKSMRFREFVHNNYGELLSELIILVNEVTFSRVDIRLAHYLLKISDKTDMVHSTHQQLALDMGSVREVISRYLNEWENQGWVKNQRGKIQLLNKQALNDYGENNS